MDSTHTHSETGGVAAFEENFPWEFDASIKVGEANHSPGMSQSVAQKARDNGVERTCSGGVCFPNVLSPKAPFGYLKTNAPRRPKMLLYC
jgi:hypothetical protein